MAPDSRETDARGMAARQKVTETHNSENCRLGRLGACGADQASPGGEGRAGAALAALGRGLVFELADLAMLVTKAER